jgi:hypothetical protein
MRTVLRFTGGLFLLFVGITALASDDKQEKPAPKPGSTETKKEHPAKPKPFVSAKPFRAKIVRVESAQRMFSVEITIPKGQENVDAARTLINLRQQLLTTRDAGSIRNIQIEIAKNQANLYSVKEEKQNVEVEAVDEMKVRTMILPVETDEKGKPRKLTEKEKRELKGPDTNLKGYMAEFDSLKPGQIVDVYLEKPAKGSKQVKTKDLAAVKEKPKVVMMLILQEPLAK